MQLPVEVFTFSTPLHLQTLNHGGKRLEVGIVRNDLRCDCHICLVERHLFVSLMEPPGSIRFLSLRARTSLLAQFTDISELLAYFHSPTFAGTDPVNAGRLLAALISARGLVADSEVVHSVLLLTFAPTIHRTFREVCAWFKELEPADVAQQILTFFLELTVSSGLESLVNFLPIALARSLRKNSFRWVEKEKRALSRRQGELQAQRGSAEPAAEDQFETLSVLNDFFDHCTQIGALSHFERELLIRFKVDGFRAKELHGRHTVLSERAVFVRVHRIMQRLQKVAGAT
jgi:hypothetical protein